MEDILGRGSGSRSTLIVRGAATLVVLALAFALTTAYMRGVFRDTVEVKAVIADAGGSLVPGADVKSRGVLVGKATSLKLTEEGVAVTLVLDGGPARKIPADVRARVLPATVFGTSYVDLVAAKGHTSEMLQAGQRIAQDDSKQTLELQTTLDSVYRVMSAVKPAELATTLTAMSQALEGRGDELGESMEDLEAYLTRLNPHMGLVREDLRLLSRNLENLDKNAPDLFAAVEDGLVTMRTLTQKKADLTSILTGGSALVAEADRFLTAEERPFVATIRQTAQVVDAFYDERANIAPGFRAFVEFGKRGATAMTSGPFLDTNARIVTSNLSAYTSADCPRYREARGDNCGGGASSGSSSPTSVSSVPGIDADLVAELQDRLSQFDGTPGGGVAELLSRPLIGEGR